MSRGEPRHVNGACGSGHHPECPGRTPAHKLPDPHRAGTFYTTPERVCPCSCHQRVEIQP